MPVSTISNGKYTRQFITSLRKLHINARYVPHTSELSMKLDDIYKYQYRKHNRTRFLRLMRYFIHKIQSLGNSREQHYQNGVYVDSRGFIQISSKFFTVNHKRFYKNHGRQIRLAH